MAKKTEDLKLSDHADRVIKEIRQIYGEGITKTAQAIIERKRITIPVSPSIDQILDGGIPEGTWVTFTGPEKSGKTTLALHFAGNAQKEEFGGKHVYYIDAEARLKKMNLTGVYNLSIDPSKFTVIQSTEEKPLTGQDFLSIIDIIVRTHRNCVVIIDSMSVLADTKELDGGIGTKTRGGFNQDVAQFIRNLIQVVPFKDSIVISITHQIANTGGYGAPKSEKSSSQLKYQTDVKLIAKTWKPWLVGEAARPIGQIVEWEAKVSALGSPMGKCDGYIRYGYGIDETYELIDIAKACGEISKAGSWFTCDFMEKHLDILGTKDWDDKSCKFQGQDALRNHLVNNPEWAKALRNDLKGFMA